MESLKFKTNINCGGCVAKVTPALNNADGICHWNVDTNDTNKTLTVHTDGITEQEVLDVVEKAGFKIEPIK